MPPAPTKIVNLAVMLTTALCVAGCASTNLLHRSALHESTDDGLLPRAQRIEACLTVARSLDEAGRGDSALRLYNRAIEFGADEQPLAARLAVLEAQHGDPARADAMFRVAIKNDDRNPALRDEYATFLKTRGQSTTVAAATDLRLSAASNTDRGIPGRPTTSDNRGVVRVSYHAASE
ncbi:MAG: hypothetical protein AAF532_05005 [Planctomycetota bacterium]